MESTPVGVIVGLFSAISQKVPAFSEWETRKHHMLLNSNTAVCQAMEEVRDHIARHGKPSYTICLDFISLKVDRQVPPVSITGNF